MNELLPIPANPLRYISQVMVFVTLAWLIVPESQMIYQNPEVKFINTVQCAIQAAVLKTKTQYFSLRDYYSEIDNSVFNYCGSLLLSHSLLITYRALSERNPFYVHITINAP